MCHAPILIGGLLTYNKGLGKDFFGGGIGQQKVVNAWI